MDSFGPGVSRVLQSSATQYLETIWQQGKPPTDADLNLIQQLASEGQQAAVLRGMPSGFLSNDVNSHQAFFTDPSWSNYFRFGPQRAGEVSPVVWAHVNGWLIPVAGTLTGAPPGSPNDTDYGNVIALDPPPESSGDYRIDFVFLEVWKARIQPNPQSKNKPSESGIYRYGNVETGFAYLIDDLKDPAIGFETNQRVQIQYRIRVVKGLVGLSLNPDGFDPVVVKAQGAADAPTPLTFTNMRQTLGDPGLWRAGDGTQNILGTVDGYSYAVPIAIVFRRNAAAWAGNPSQNLNGALNRNPLAVDRAGIKTFAGWPQLGAPMTVSASTLQLSTVANIPLPPATPATPVTIRVGDEVMQYTGISSSTLTISARGYNGTLAEAHRAGSVVRVLPGRPDGLFADEIVSTDILDLRHMVNPNGFDYAVLLKGSLDKLLRGQLRSTWKLTGAVPRGPYVHYQDTFSFAPTGLGITKLDAPDNIRMVFSDGAVVQPIELVCRPANGSVSAAGTAINDSTWSLRLTVNATVQSAVNRFQPGDTLVVPVGQLKDGLQAGSSDQVRWLNDGVPGAVALRFAGDTHDIPSTMYTVTPASPGPSDNLTIVFGASFPATEPSKILPLHIRVHAVYGPGRGLARRPNAVHSASYASPSSALLPSDISTGPRISWSPLWSRYRRTMWKGLLPSTSEMYADSGSKTLVISPFRTIEFPQCVTVDGRAANLTWSVDGSGQLVLVPKAGAPTTGQINTAMSDVISVASVVNVAVGDALVVSSGPGQGRYVVSATNAAPPTITVERPIRAVQNTVLSFAVYNAQGCMPLKSRTGADKWTQTDPLGLFCGTVTLSDVYESIYVSLPRHLVPGWGELAVPLVSTGVTGIHYMIRTGLGDATLENQNAYAAYSDGGETEKEYAVFSQVTPTAVPSPLAYNEKSVGAGGTWAGMRFFSDSRGLGREGLELPPFYGVARLMGVYQASDYFTNGSAFNTTREPRTGTSTPAANLLRQSMTLEDGPSMWIETDADGDSTFILNAKAIDVSKAPSIASFAAGTYVIEAVVFGFDRGAFDLDSEFRLVLTRPDETGRTWTNVGSGPVSQGVRALNINQTVVGPLALLPGPAPSGERISVNYSRTVYQGDAWGSQTSNVDLPYSPGPLTTTAAFQVSSQSLDPSSLTRPHQKVLEVLASTGFSTTLGTGRFVGDIQVGGNDVANVGYEDPAAFPPATELSTRPRTLTGNFVSGDAAQVGSEYLGCTERLPLGALFRDSNFRGQSFTNIQSPLVYWDGVGVGGVTEFAGGGPGEWGANTATAGMGQPGDLLVYCDGEQNNYSLTNNFRVARGGSVFNATLPRPGGSLSMQAALPGVPRTDHVNVLHGRAMLVRNAVTNVGLNEVSAGDELMMLIVTSAERLVEDGPNSGLIRIGTNGAGEGYSAADLYRIEGHPLVRNHGRTPLDPSTIVLTRR